jgi:AcrR family transcriptional regulator
MASAAVGPPGRPRSAAIDQAILRAAFDLFIEHGIEGTSIERIARRAGVAKTSIYRRWPNRDALLAQAIEAARNAVAPTAEMVERASPEAFVQLLVEAAALLGRPEIRRLLARLIGSIPDRPQLFRIYRETYYLPRRRALLRALQRAQGAGRLHETGDIELLADMLLGALVYRMLFADDAEQSPRAYALALLRQLGFPPMRASE